MNTPDSLKKNKSFINLILTNWDNLENNQKAPLIKLWKVLTYKWQLQILFNLPFLLWWGLDKTFTPVHSFNIKLINYLNIPDWLLSMIGFSQSLS